MLYDNLGNEIMNDYNQVIPNYITLNNFYINNNQILLSASKKNGPRDNYGLNNNNYNNDLNYKYNAQEHMNNFLSPKRGLNQMDTYQRKAFFSPPPIQTSQKFKSILTKSEVPLDDMDVQRINSDRNLIYENKDGPKDTIRIYKSIDAIKRHPDIIGNSLNMINNYNINNIKVVKLNRKNENNVFIRHPLDNNRNYLTKSKYNRVINDLERKPQDNLRNYVEININERINQPSEKEVNINKDIKQNDNDKESQNDSVHNIKDESIKFNSNEKGKEKEKGNVHSNWDKIMKKFDKSEDKKKINKNSLSKDRNTYKDEGKNNRINIIYNNTRKGNLNSSNNNNMQNRINLRTIKDSIKGEIIKKDNINEDKNNKNYDIKDDKMKNDIKIYNKEINKPKIKNIKELNNKSKNEKKNKDIKNNIINEDNTGKIINDIIGENKIEINNENFGNIKKEKKKNNYSNINQIIIKNDNKNKELKENEIKEKNKVESKEIISNKDINNNLNMNLNNENLAKGNNKEKNIIEDTKEKINKIDKRINEENLKNNVLSKEKAEDKIQKNIPKIDKNENLPKTDNNFIIIQRDNIIEDKDNKDNFNQINHAIVPPKEEHLYNNIIYDIKKEMISNEEIKIQRCSSFKDRKRTSIDNLNEIVENKNVSKNNNNINVIDAFNENNKDVEKNLHKNILFRSLDEHDFKNLKQTYQIPVENSFEKPEFILNPQDYKYFGVMGEGEYGKIYLTQSMKDNQYYAIKIETFKNRGEAHKSQKITKMVKDLLKNTNSEGICKIYGDIWFKKNNIYYYYVLMEKAERDMEQELVIRGNYVQYYSEVDLTNVLCQLILTCSQLQKNNIAHRDIKPQNILILDGRYKLCDFGEAISFNKTGVGVVVQKIRGTELYMSPILFFGLKKNYEKVKHNAYKSDVFSLGLCILLAGTLNYDSICQIRELTDMEAIKNIIMYYLSPRYSTSFISFLLKMIEIDENKRPDFIQLENLLVKK